MLVHAAVMSKILGDHRRMKCDQASGIVNVGEQRGDVAVAGENLWVAANEREIKIWQQVIATVAAARTDNGANFRTLEHLMQFVQASLDAASEIKIVME